MASVVQTVLHGAPPPKPRPMIPSTVVHPQLAPGYVAPPPPPKPPVTVKGLLDSAKAVWTDTSNAVTRNMSVHDQLSAYGGKDFADRIFVNSVDNISDSADAYANAAKVAGDERLRLFYDTLDKHSGMQTLHQVLWPSARKKGMAQRAVLEDETMRYLNSAYYHELRGDVLAPHSNKQVQELVESYRQSGFARDSLDRRIRAGEDIQGVTPSDNYVPQNWSYHKYVAKTRGNKMYEAGYAKAFGEQILDNYPGLARAGLSADQVGRSFLKTQRDKITMEPNAPLKGVSMQEVMQILEREITDPAVIQTLKAQLQPKVSAAGKQANTKTRMSFDIAKVFTHQDGSQFKLGDVMDTSMQRVLESYNLNASARIGLAKKGITSSDQLTAELSAILKKYEGDPRKHAEVKEFLDNVKNDMLHRPTGEALADWMRTGQVAANALFLKRSGLYNFVDYARAIERFGFTKVATNFIPAFRGVMSTTPMDVTAARKITDIVHSQLTNQGRLYSVISHLEDNFAAPVTIGHEWAQTAGQTVRFINGSEILRRQHIKLISNIHADILNDLGKGVKSSSDYFDSLNVPKHIQDQIADSVRKHGLYTENWNQNLVDHLTTVLIHDTDNMALMLKRGETPAIMRYSVPGKIIFPFFSFAAAANQKILRQTYRSDGVSGVAITMAHQASLAVVVAAAANVLDGKEWDDDLIKRSVMIAPILGYTGYLAGMVNQGQVGNTPNVFALPDNIMKAQEALFKGDMAAVMHSIPGVAISPPLMVFDAIFKE